MKRKNAIATLLLCIMYIAVCVCVGFELHRSHTYTNVYTYVYTCALNFFVHIFVHVYGIRIKKKNLVCIYNAREKVKMQYRDDDYEIVLIFFFFTLDSIIFATL